MLTNSQTSTPYTYYNSADPTGKYNPDGTLKSDAGNGIQSGVEAGVGYIPIVGSFISGASKASHAIRSANTGYTDVIGGALAPHTQAFDDWTKAGQATSTGKKVENAFSGIADIALGPAYSGIKALVEGNKRRRDQAGWNYSKQFENGAGYGYGLDADGINYASHLRAINGVNKGNPHPEVQAAIGSIGAAGANLLKQFLSRSKAPANPDGSGILAPTTTIQPSNIPTVGSGDVPYRDMSAAPFAGNANTALPAFGANDQSPVSSIFDGSNQGIDSTVGVQGLGGGSDVASLFQSGAGATDFPTDIPDVSEGYHNGGKMWAYEGGGVAHVTGGKGNDDIALVEVKTGKDTKIRVEKGEMIVFSKDNVDAITEAVKSGDQNKLFNLVADQIKQKGKVKDGKLNHKRGGVGKTDADWEGSSGKVDPEGLSDAERYRLKQQKIKDLMGDSTSPEDIDKQIAEIKRNYPDYVSQNLHHSFFGKTPKEQIADLEEKKRQINNGGMVHYDTPSKEGAYKVPYQAKIPAHTIDANHPLAQAALSATHMNGAPMAKKVGNTVVMTDPHGNVVGKPYGPEEAGFDINGKPLGPFGQAINTKTTGGGQSKTTYTPLEAEKEKIDFGSAANYGLDTAKFILGSEGAATALPTWQVPANWTEYSNEAKHRAQQGLSPYQIALAKNGADNTYLTSLERNRNIAGGNAGLIIAADNMANQNHNNAALQLAAADYGANQNNFRAYAPIAEQDVNHSRTIYNDLNDRAMWTKQSGAVLMNKAADDIANQALTEQYYGPKSAYGELLDLSKQKSQAEINALNSQQNLWAQKELTQSKQPVVDTTTGQVVSQPVVQPTVAPTAPSGLSLTPDELSMWQNMKYGDAKSNPQLQSIAAKLRAYPDLNKHWQAAKITGDASNGANAFTDDELLSGFNENKYDLNNFTK